MRSEWRRSAASGQSHATWHQRQPWLLLPPPLLKALLLVLCITARSAQQQRPGEHGRGALVWGSRCLYGCPHDDIASPSANKRAKSVRAPQRRASRAAGAAGPEAEALFEPGQLWGNGGQSAEEKRLRKELDEELNRTQKENTTAGKPHLGDLGGSATPKATGTAPDAAGDVDKDCAPLDPPDVCVCAIQTLRPDLCIQIGGDDI